jgi:hypothetical protein
VTRRCAARHAARFVANGPAETPALHQVELPRRRRVRPSSAE